MGSPTLWHYARDPGPERRSIPALFGIDIQTLDWALGLLAESHPEPAQINMRHSFHSPETSATGAAPSTTSLQTGFSK